MKKLCLACRQPVSDDTKQFCPKCETLQLDKVTLTDADKRASSSASPHAMLSCDEDLQKLSQIVLGKLKADWHFKGQIIFYVLCALVALMGLLDVIWGFNLKSSVSQRFQTLETETANRISVHLATLDTSVSNAFAKADTQMSNIVGIHLSRLDMDVSNALAQVDFQMRSNVTRSFANSNIQTIIQQVAKEEAKDILEGEVQPAVNSFRDDALFIRTVARAQAFDYRAYKQLLENAKLTNANAVLAKQITADIDRTLEKDRQTDVLGKRKYGTCLAD